MNSLDRLPSFVLANLYEGLVREEAATHALVVRGMEQSVNRYINQLQDATSKLQHLSFDGRGQQTLGQREQWMTNIIDTAE